MLNCDAETGLCQLPDSTRQPSPQQAMGMATTTVRYIGDPMCSWCWGISPALQTLAAYCWDHRLDFRVHVGGLRAGGGDAWNTPFKAFLRHEWETIQRVTGQPFGFSLLEQATFNYDTEPACRAVVAMSHLLAARTESSQTLLAFFSGIQKQFYVDGSDPKQAAFYRPLCAQIDVPYEDFLQRFLSPQAQDETLAEFQRCRSWGVRAFPSILLDSGGQIRLLASGHSNGPALIEKLESLLGDAAANS